MMAQVLRQEEKDKMENTIENSHIRGLELRYRQLASSLEGAYTKDRKLELLETMFGILDEIEELNAKKDAEGKA